MLRQALHDAEAGAAAALLQQQESDEAEQQKSRGGRYGSMSESTPSNSARTRSNHAATADRSDPVAEGNEDEEEERQSTFDDEDDEEESDEGDEDEDDEDENQEEEDLPLPRYLRIWETIKNGIRIVANVENLWDESVTPPESASASLRSGTAAAPSTSGSASSHASFPPHPPHPRLVATRAATSPGGGDAHRVKQVTRVVAVEDQSNRLLMQQGVHRLNDEVMLRQHRQRRIRTRNLIVFFWFVVLAMSYASERSTFKLLVDRAGPFRLFAVEVVTLAHAVLLVAGIALSRLARDTATHRSTRGGAAAASSSSSSSASSSPFNPFPAPSLGISVVDVALMALLESIQLIIVFLTGLHVPPTLTVILIQFTLPLTAFLTQFVHPKGRCSCVGAAAGVTANSESGDASVTPGGATTTTPPPPPPPPTQQQPPVGDPYGQDPRHHRDSRFPQYPRDAMLEGLLPRDDDRHGGMAVAVGFHPACRRAGAGQMLDQCGGLSMEHVWGSLIIFLAVLLALIPAFVAIARPEFFDYADTIPIRTAFNTLLYVSSCIPAAASQLYKEHVFLQYKQPVNMTTLNLLLSVFEFVFCSILAPLVFGLQGLGAPGRWASLYPSSKFSENFWDGIKCFLRILPNDDQENKYYDDARCDFALGLVLFHAFSIAAVGVAVDKIVNAGATKVMYRGMSAGIVLAVLCMHAYDMRIPEFSYGAAVDGLNLACLIILILGSEVYHRVALKDLTFDTVYQQVQIEALYDA